MRKIGEGDKSEVFVLPDGRILKLFFGHYADLAPIEAALSTKLVRAGVDAPSVDECIEVDGRPGIVFGNLHEGITLSSDVRKRPWRIMTAARSLAGLHAAVHECSSEELPSQRERLVSEIESSDAISPETRDLALRVLADLPDGTTVCHNDIHMLNVIVHESGATLIDWVLATRGNPTGDLAGAILQLRFGEKPKGLVAGFAMDAGRAAFWRLYLRQYLSLRPVSHEELIRWQLPFAAALAGRRAGRMRAQLQEHIAHLQEGKHRHILENAR
jgi:aminoglycoside phosphotransferase (APT) family kinase protein